jgi:hypothetical protein
VIMYGAFLINKNLNLNLHAEFENVIEIDRNRQV